MKDYILYLQLNYISNIHAACTNRFIYVHMYIGGHANPRTHVTPIASLGILHSCSHSGMYIVKKNGIPETLPIALVLCSMLLYNYFVNNYAKTDEHHVATYCSLLSRNICIYVIGTYVCMFKFL